MAEATRVALLARPGGACERLQAALQEAGAEVVLVADPTVGDAAGVRAAGAQAVLVALEPLVEDVLDRFDEVLSDPAVTVIFDEAELAAQREGWDAARWARHLAAKLSGHGNVLPPGPDAEPEDDPQSATLTLALPDAAGWESGDSGAGAGDLDLSAFDADAFASGSAQSGSGVPDLGELDLADFAAEADALAASLALDSPDPGRESGDDASGHAFDPVAFEFDEMSLAADALPSELLLSALDPAPQDGALTAPDASASAFDPDQLSLEEPEGSAAGEAVASDDPVTRDRFRRDLDALNARIADMELVDAPRERASGGVTGAVVVLAGIGGPDAVRQLLGGLPAGFPRPVLVQQRLDGARHDKLVRQMQRATSMPVHLAEAGMALANGNVYVLPADLGVAADAAGLRFEAAGDVLAGLPSNDCAVVMLSGSDPASVDVALGHAARGALVAGQAPDGCYDAAAPEMLVARGGVAGTPAELAKKLAARWPA